MSAEAEILDELHRLRSRMPQLTGALAASADGLVLAQDSRGVEPEGVAALTAAALGIALRLTDATGQGGFRELLVRSDRGYVATYAAGPSAVLTLLAEGRVNVGRLHLEGRRSSSRISELLQATGRATAQQPDRPRGQPSALTDAPPLPIRPTSPRAGGSRSRSRHRGTGETPTT
ncbi:roadblock/LC7 domain protein [Streptomyces himastatinicus ATCC 53653]|uniref:Roadblock/LC7 domain protein n=1 Tax=Streptomyces himastatinicus ATCC 53653 TaxID=457427 RepID=D9WT51_9ACTN|nr:roadblock/LC7 domain-containing protein [Streptomyces himastatinicus]EFL26272.1 roadblock/LC7 domain protein [Streptomyces himastatinicus ATCC 53653]